MVGTCCMGLLFLGGTALALTPGGERPDVLKNSRVGCVCQEFWENPPAGSFPPLHGATVLACNPPVYYGGLLYSIGSGDEPALGIPIPDYSLVIIMDGQAVCAGGDPRVLGASWKGITEAQIDACAAMFNSHGCDLPIPVPRKQRG